jgi:hypothetical protein
MDTTTSTWLHVIEYIPDTPRLNMKTRQQQSHNGDQAVKKAFCVQALDSLMIRVPSFHPSDHFLHSNHDVQQLPSTRSKPDDARPSSKPSPNHPSIQAPMSKPDPTNSIPTMSTRPQATTAQPQNQKYPNCIPDLT